MYMAWLAWPQTTPSVQTNTYIVYVCMHARHTVTSARYTEEKHWSIINRNILSTCERSKWMANQQEEQQQQQSCKQHTHYNIILYARSPKINAGKKGNWFRLSIACARVCVCVWATEPCYAVIRFIRLLARLASARRGYKCIPVAAVAATNTRKRMQPQHTHTRISRAWSWNKSCIHFDSNGSHTGRHSPFALPENT